MFIPQDKFMRVAIKEAMLAKEKGDYAIGAVIVRNNKIIVRGSNRARIDQDSTQHAEMVVIRKAFKKLNSRFLSSCVLYTTHEPCPMCAAGAIWARMDGIVFGATLQDMINYKNKKGNRKLTWRTIDIPAKNILTKGEPRLKIIGKFMRVDCLKLFHNFKK